jgi:prophage regulatory protein
MEIDRMLRIAEVLRITGVSTATLYRWVKDGTFPAPVKLGPNSVAWRASVVRDWIDSRQPVVDELSRTGGDVEMRGAP